MFRPFRTLIFGLGLWFFAQISVALAVHPYHVSFAEVEWNQKTGHFEVALCVWPADLEKALAKQQQQPVDLDKIEDLDSMLKAYVATKFRISSTKNDVESVDSTPEVRWVGHEKNNKKAWLYFEIQGSSTHQKWTLQNRLFCELNDDQENHIQLTVGKRVTNHVSGNKKVEFATE